MVRESLASGSIASGPGVARSVKFQPGLDRSYHKRMRIKIRPSACIDCRIENSQNLLGGPPDTRPLARHFVQEEARQADLLPFRVSRGLHGRKHLPTVPWQSHELPDG